MIDSMPIHQGRMLPQFTLRQIDMPDIVSWDVNSQHYLIMKVEVAGKRNRKDLEAPTDRVRIEADFQVMSIKALGIDPVDVTSLEQEEFENITAQVKSGKLK